MYEQNIQVSTDRRSRSALTVGLSYTLIWGVLCWRLFLQQTSILKTPQLVISLQIGSNPVLIDDLHSGVRAGS